MSARRSFAWLLAAGVAALAVSVAPASAQEKKKDEPRKGTVTGVIAAKGENWIEVRADGEEKARKYVVGRNNVATLKAIKETPLESRIQLEWAFGESLIAMKFEVLKKGGKGGKDEKKEPGKDEPRKGTVTGEVTAKGENWIEVKADGEEKGRRYVPHWKGGLPKDGGGPDKAMLAKIKDTPLKSRVKIDWEFEERARVVKIEVLKKSEKQ